MLLLLSETARLCDRIVSTRQVELQQQRHEREGKVRKIKKKF